MSNGNSNDLPDVGFKMFFTPVWVAVIWWCTVIATLTAYAWFLYAYRSELLYITIANVFIGGGIAIISLLASRMALELIAVIFRIEKHLRTIKNILKKAGYLLCSTYVKMGEWSRLNRQIFLQFTAIL
jgi:hypothetical protein